MDAANNAAVGRATLARVTLRLIPFMFLLYIVAFLDRVNVGFAALQMNEDLGFSDAVYGFGAGIFFIGYFIFEVPSTGMLFLAVLILAAGLLALAVRHQRSLEAVEEVISFVTVPGADARTSS